MTAHVHSDGIAFYMMCRGKRQEFVLSTSDAERFWAKVDKSGGPGECWPWRGSMRKSTNYGGFGVGGLIAQAHRVSYTLTKGSIPEGLTLDHLCRCRPCVNPDHLEAVDLRTNILRGVGASARAARQTHCPAGHPYTERNLVLWRQGWRYCRECRVARQRKQRAVARAVRLVASNPDEAALLQDTLERLIVKHCYDTGTNIPPDVIARYLADCLVAFDSAVQRLALAAPKVEGTT